MTMHGMENTVSAVSRTIVDPGAAAAVLLEARMNFVSRTHAKSTRGSCAESKRKGQIGQLSVTGTDGWGEQDVRD